MPPQSSLAPVRTIQRPGTLKDLAYREILHQLISGQLEPGRLYSAPYFAAKLGISRTPAREALLQLANLGFLVCLDVRGFRLKEYSEQEIHDVFEARQVIEAHVLTQLASQPDGDHLVQLEEALEQMAHHAARGNAIGFLEADRRFHMIPVERAGNQFLAGVMEDIRNHIAVLGVRALAHASRFEEVLQEHSAILAALRSRCADQILQSLQCHLTATQKYLLTS